MARIWKRMIDDFLSAKSALSAVRFLLSFTILKYRQAQPGHEFCSCELSLIGFLGAAFVVTERRGCSAAMC